MKRVLIPLMVVMVFVGVSCGDKGDKNENSIPVGSLGFPCIDIGDGICVDDLVCEDGICVVDESGDTGNTGDIDSIDDTDIDDTESDLINDLDDDTGNTGDDSDTGNTGNTGDTGDTGDTGNTGDSGATCTGSDKFCHFHDDLNWSDASSIGMTWDEAVIYCENLGGRLPNITELRTIIINCPGSMTGGACAVNEPDHLSHSADYSDDCFCNGSAESYSALGDKKIALLSSSKLSDYTDRAWYVYFLMGDVGNDESNYGHVRCVR